MAGLARILQIHHRRAAVPIQIEKIATLYRSEDTFNFAYLGDSGNWNFDIANERFDGVIGIFPHANLTDFSEWRARLNVPKHQAHVLIRSHV